MKMTHTVYLGESEIHPCHVYVADNIAAEFKNKQVEGDGREERGDKHFNDEYGRMINKKWHMSKQCMLLEQLGIDYEVTNYNNGTVTYNLAVTFDLTPEEHLLYVLGGC